MPNLCARGYTAEDTDNEVLTAVTVEYYENAYYGMQGEWVE